MGGRKSDLNDLAREVWIWCAEPKIVLSVFHIPGRLNLYADAFSRQILNEDMEWILHKSIFNRIRARFGNFDVDMFASCYNHQFHPYVSYLPDESTMAIKAFLLDWGKYFSDIFAPFSVNGDVLKKVEEAKADAVIIAPLFSTQQLLQMIIDMPLLLPKSENLLCHPVTQKHITFKNWFCELSRSPGRTAW